MAWEIVSWLTKKKKRKKFTKKTKILILDFVCYQVNFFSYRTNCFYRNECFSSNPIPIRVAIGTDWENWENVGKGKRLLSVFCSWKLAEGKCLFISEYLGTWGRLPWTLENTIMTLLHFRSLARISSSHWNLIQNMASSPKSHSLKVVFKERELGEGVGAQVQC